MPSKWEIFFDECIKEIAKEVLVLDLGSGEPFQKELAKYRGLFKNCKYYSLDFDAQYEPNIIGDIHYLPFKDETADAIICKAVLEHVPEPQKAVREIYRVLRKGGKTFIYAPFLFPYHGSRRYKDYYRFTKDGIEYMFRDFTEIRMVPVRGYLGTINLFIPYTSKNFWLTKFLDKLTSTSTTMTSGYNILAIK